RCAMNRRLFRIMRVRAHLEGAAGNPDHVRGDLAVRIAHFFRSGQHVPSLQRSLRTVASEWNANRTVRKKRCGSRSACRKKCTAEAREERWGRETGSNAKLDR